MESKKKLRSGIKNTTFRFLAILKSLKSAPYALPGFAVLYDGL